MRRRRKQLGPTPLPEAIMGGAWRVEPGMPMVNLQDRVMSVPLGETAAAEFLRAHEMAHVKITPPKHAYQLAEEARASITAVQAVEDFRVHEFLRMRGFARPAVISERELRESMQSVRDIKTAASMLLAVYNCPDQAQPVLNAIKACSHFDEFVKGGIETIVRTTVNMFHKHVTDAARRGMTPIHTQAGFDEVTAPVARYFDSLFADSDLIPAEEYASYSRQDHVPWGTLEPIVRVPLKTAKKNKFGHQRVWRDEGVVPTAVYRLTIDNKVFARKKKSVGGTVLVDASGSMDFTNEDLADLVAVAPGATVAVYAGSGDTGRLVIVAARGKMADRVAIERALSPSLRQDGTVEDDYYEPPMCGNIVDGPALEWLGRQPGPRVWVSDGMVTGVNDAMAHNLRIDAVALMRQYDIERIEDWQELVASFK